MRLGVWAQPFSFAGFAENDEHRALRQGLKTQSSAWLQAVHPGRIIMQNHPAHLLGLFLNDEAQADGIPQGLLKGDLGGLGRQPGDFRRVVPATSHHQLGERRDTDELPVAFGHAQGDPGGRPTHVDPNMREGVGELGGVLDPWETPMKENNSGLQKLRPAYKGGQQERIGISNKTFPESPG